MLRLGGEIAQVRPSVGQVVAERLTLAHSDVCPICPRRPQKAERYGVGNHYEQGARSAASLGQLRHPLGLGNGAQEIGHLDRHRRGVAVSHLGQDLEVDARLGVADDLQA